MITVQRTFLVDSPPGTVFEYLTDFTHTEEWDPGTVTTTRLDAGPLVVGSRFRNVSKFRGKESELEYTLSRLEPPSRLTFVGVNRTVTSTDDMRFEAAQIEAERPATSITYQAHFDFHGVARLAEPFLRSTFEKIADETVERMRDTLEKQR